MTISSNISGARTPVPEGIKRQVRRRCGFGCIMCGFPLYDYDHLHGWTTTHKHDPAEIVLLCDRHHREKTAGLLPIHQVAMANENPVNRKNTESGALLLHYYGSEYEVSLAGMRFVTPKSLKGSPLVPLVIDDEPIVLFLVEDEHLLRSFSYYDESNQLMLRIRNNELVYRTDIWDIELIGKNLKLRKGMRHIILDLSLDPPNSVAINRALINRNGIRVIIDSEFVHVLNINSAVGKIGLFRTQMGIAAGRISEETKKAAAITFPVPDSSRK